MRHLPMGECNMEHVILPFELLIVLELKKK